MASDVYIADSDNGNKVYFDYDPVPNMFLTHHFITTKKRTLNTRVGGVITPGVYHYYFGGGGISGSTINLGIVKLSGTQKNALETKAEKCNYIIFSKDDGVTKYKCAFTNTQPTRISGTEYFKWDIKLNVIDTG